jgi:hypothetical protein
MLSLVAARRRQLKRIEVLRDAGPFDGFCLTSAASLARLDVQNLIREIGSLWNASGSCPRRDQAKRRPLGSPSPMVARQFNHRVAVAT